MQGCNRLRGDPSCGEKATRVNWPHHANAIQDLSSKDNFLSTGFLFSLPTQRPNPEANPEGMLSLRCPLNHQRKKIRVTSFIISVTYPCFQLSGLLLVDFKAQNAFKFHGLRRYNCGPVACYECVVMFKNISDGYLPLNFMF